MLTADGLIEFMRTKMSMSHVYQRLLIRVLVDAGGTATLRQLAREFLLQDESQVGYYEQRIREMPVRVLSKHGVVERQGGLVRLLVRPTTFKDKARVRLVCEQHLQELMRKRGLPIWDYRLPNLDPVPDVLRYQALAAGGGCSALCGATKTESPLHVDHIVPRSRGGRSVLENLQVLCSRCNLAKSNKDTTDFRSSGETEADAECPFRPPGILERLAEDHGSAFAVPDRFPVTPGHMLVLPHRHTSDYFSMTGQERRDAEDLLRYLRNRIQSDEPSAVGSNVGVNCGVAAGQTVMHAHFHLIPRREGHTPLPRGGVRGVIPERMSH